MLSKILFVLSLAVSPIVSVSAQAEYNEFVAFQTVDKYLADFDYLSENTYRVSYANSYGSGYECDFTGEPYVFYVFPIYYNIDNFGDHFIYYSNAYYNFFFYPYGVGEVVFGFNVLNYDGNKVEVPFLALDYIGMSQVIEYDKTEKSNSISIYNSFYNFFTGFFPNEVVAEYHGIFTFVIVAFLLFLVFGFVFFLFRVIRRLVGFK